MNHTSLWKNIDQLYTSFSIPEESMEADIVIIGAGITGLTAALNLYRTGKKIIVVEALKIGEGTTAFSTGNLYVPIQSYYQNMKSKFDIETVKSIVSSRILAIKYIEETAHAIQADCSFERRPWYMYTTEEDQVSFIDRELEAMKETDMLDIGYDTNFNFLKNVSIKKAIKLEKQARFNPLQYIKKLALFLKERNVLIFENTVVEDIEEEKSVCTVITQKGRIKANKVFMATHIPKGFNTVQTLAAPYRSYVVGARLKNNIYPNINAWDTSNPHHTISSHSTTNSKPDILLVAGMHHKTGQGEKHDHLHYYNQLEEFARRHFDVESFEYRWSAQHYKSGDGIPYIGPSSRLTKNIFMATGFYADGLVYGTIAGIMVSDLISGNENKWSETYNSNRLTPFKSIGEFVKENANVFGQYLKVIPGIKDAKEPEDIARGEGKVIEKKGHKIAVYHDENGNYHAVSAVCSHLGCIVKYNNAEKSWDCPCHGSRFAIDGSVIEGPAYKALEHKNLLNPD